MMITTFRSFAILLVLGLSSLPLFSQKSDAGLYIGTWKGEMTLGGRPMPVEFVFEPGGVHPKGFAVDAGGQRVPLAQVLAFSSGVIFRLDRGEGSFMVFASKLGADKASLSGDVTIMEGKVERGKALWIAKKVAAAPVSSTPPTTAPMGPTVVQAAEERGRALLFKKDYNGAAAAFSDCLKVEPTNSSCIRSRAIAYHKAAKYQEAVNDFDAAIKAMPKPPSVLYIARGEARMGLTDYEGAIADADLAFAVNANPDAYLLRGEAYQLSGSAIYFNGMIRGKEAEARAEGMAISAKGLIEIDKFIQLKPNEFRGYLKRGSYYYHLWNAYTDDSKLTASLSDINKALTLSPQNPDIFYARYITYEALGQKAASNADLAKYHELSKK